jgi:hypothetical protein
VAGARHILSVDIQPLAPLSAACVNRLDDDGDGRIDLEDTGCTGPTDATGPKRPPQIRPKDTAKRREITRKTHKTKKPAMSCNIAGFKGKREATAGFEPANGGFADFQSIC